MNASALHAFPVENQVDGLQAKDGPLPLETMSRKALGELPEFTLSCIPDPDRQRKTHVCPRQCGVMVDMGPPIKRRHPNT